MKVADIRGKSDKELQTLLADSRKSLAEAVIEMRTTQVKNVKQIAAVKKTIARAITERRERELKKLEESNV